MRVIILTLTLILSFSLFAGERGFAPTDSKKLSSNKFKSITIEGVTIDIPSSWVQSVSNKSFWSDSLGNSVNIVSENAGEMSDDAYIKLSIKNMKKMLPSYKVISDKKGKGLNVKYTVYLGEYSLKDIGAPSGSIRLYTVFLETKGLKYVVTIAGLPAQFETKDSIFKKMMASIKLDSSYKEVVNNLGGVQIIAGKISIEVPKGWNKKTSKDMWIDPKTYSSVNVTTENTPQYKLKPYLKLSLTNMKKAIKTYVLIKQEIKIINGNEVGILFGKFTMSNMDLHLYSVIIDIKGMKYVLSVGGPSKTFDSLDSTFIKIINSLKKL